MKGRRFAEPRPYAFGQIGSISSRCSSNRCTIGDTSKLPALPRMACSSESLRKPTNDRQVDVVQLNLKLTRLKKAQLDAHFRRNET